jgi:hypothetical protein
MIRLRGDSAMNVAIRRGVISPRMRMQARALRSWRIAADLVWTRWDAFREATSDRRPLAWAAYSAALDAEASAAAALAETKLGRPA